MKLLKDAADGGSPDQSAFDAAGALIGYCILGPDEFGEINGAWRTAPVQDRLVAAFVNGERSLDEDLVLLMFCAGLVHPDVVDRYGLTVI